MDFHFFTEDEQPTMGNFNEKFASIVAIAGEKAKITYGNYVGTDPSDINANKTISLPFHARFLFIISPLFYIGHFDNKVAYFAAGNQGIQIEGKINSDHTVTFANNSVSFGHSKMNFQGITYHYVAIG